MSERDLACVTAAKPLARLDELTRTEWLDLRRSTGIGGSDVAALLGLSPWSSPYALWLDKTGRKPPEDNSTMRLRAGHFLEPFVISEAEIKHPDLHVSRAPYMLGHPDHRELFVDVDGLAVSNERRARGGFEAKTTEQTMAHHWSDGVPSFYETQAYHSLEVTGLDWWMVAVMIGLGSQPLQTYVIERNEAIQAAIKTATLEWWQTHVVEGQPPAVDGSAATTEALSMIQANQGAVKVLEGEDLAAISDGFRQLAHDAALIADAEATTDTFKNQLRFFMDDATELVDDRGQTWATWRADKHGRRALRTTPGLNIVKKDS